MRFNSAVRIVRSVHPLAQAEIISALADRVNRLTVSRHDPEAFYAERSDISAGLRALARRLTQERHAA